MKKLMTLTLILLLANTFAALPTQQSDVDVFKELEQPQFENIPLQKNVFKGAKDSQEREALKEKCQQWVITELQKAQAPYFKAWCSLKTDIILREYSYTGYLLIKSW